MVVDLVLGSLLVVVILEVVCVVLPSEDFVVFTVEKTKEPCLCEFLRCTVFVEARLARPAVRSK